MVMEFTPEEYKALAIVQKDLPDSLTPYADIAQASGLTEEEVIALLSGLKDRGVIRRFGASIKHQRTGWNQNAMVAWISDESVAATAGPIAAEHPHISHCYYRPSDAPDWPYTFFTMIHGKEPGDIDNTIAEIKRTTPLTEAIVLESLKELKKISMTYFTETDS